MSDLVGYPDVTVFSCEGSFFFLYQIPHLLFQGQEGARITRLAEDGKPVCFIDEDIQTLHEAYKRGARESSKLLGTESLLLG